MKNQSRLRRRFRQLLMRDVTPVFLVFTPDIVHFAPYCISRETRGFEPILILNAVSRDDEAWLKTLYPELIVVRIATSLTGNPDSILGHGDVLNDLFSIVEKPFCIQDPDCFVTDTGFWDEVKFDSERHFAAGPFSKTPKSRGHSLPQTFFLLLNTDLFRRISGQYRVDASRASRIGMRVQEKIETLGYLPGEYPDQFKGYFDTLHAYWLVAMAEGYKYRLIPGADQTVFHIGGTSYLHRSDYDLSHWDYWPLSVIYFNLFLLELPAGRQFRKRFGATIERFNSTESVLRQYPDFCNSERLRLLQPLLLNITQR